MRRKKASASFLVVLIVSLLFTYFQQEHAFPTSLPGIPLLTPSPAVQSAQDESLYTVTKVADGDTITVTHQNTKETIRLIGLDTPEVVDPRKPVQCYGREASQKAKELLLNKQVRLEADASQSEKDKYGRLLRYVYLVDGTLFNKWMIEEGYAYEYTYDNPYMYQEAFKRAQQQAMSQQKGLWGGATCSGER